MGFYSRQLLTIVLIVFTLNGFAATIKGNITDKKTGEPVIGAVVVLHGTNMGTITGLDGSYVINKIPGGSYEVEINYTAYETFKQSVTLSETQTIILNQLMMPVTSQLKEVEVKAKMSNGSDEQARNIEKNSDNVMNILSAKTIELLPDITIANVLQRVSGVTVQRDANGEARYVIIRGMEKRYNYTTVNGIKIPSPDDKMRYVPMDIFPAELVDRVEVIKTLTPGMEGDAIGGVMNMAMKNAPDHLVVYASAATGYNQTLIDRDYLGFPKSGLNLKNPAEFYHSVYIPTVADFQRKTLDFTKSKAPANGMMSFTIGDRFLKNKKLGAIVSGSYQNTYKGSNTIFFLPSIQPGVNNAPSVTDLEIRKYSTQESRTGLHSKIDYEFNNKNSLSLYALYLQLDELQTRDVIDTTVQINRTGPGTGAIDYTTRSAFRTQKIQNLTLQGKHLLASNLKLDYSLVYSLAKKDVPDMAELHTYSGAYIDTITGKSTAPQPNLKSISHSWERTTDEDHSGYLNLTYTPTIAGKDVEFMAGGMFRNKQRTNYYNSYSLDPATAKQPFTNVYDAGLLLKNPAGELSNGLNYNVTEDIMAGYGQAKVTLNKLQILGGVRVENTHEKYAMNVDPSLVPGQNGEFKYTDVLPSINFKYALATKQNIRLSYYESISRPGFFEIVPASFTGEYYTETGNDSLNHTVAQNFDLRYEWFPKGIDQVLVGTFYKSITNPIEYLLDAKAGKASAGYLMPTNVTDKPATIFGAELVVTKYFHYFGISANYTYTHSEITTNKSIRYRDSSGSITTNSIAVSRPLQGQSEHVANLALIYKNPKIGLDAHISWVYTGRRISFLSSYDGLDYWQKATSFFDFSCEKRIVKHLSVYAKVNNLLNSAVIIELLKSNADLKTGTLQLPYQELPSNILVQKDYYGRNYLVGLRYKFN